MTTKTLIIKELRRTSQLESDEVLKFKAGVNVIVGVGNTGKTKWLSMLDYLMGDDGSPEDAFSTDLVDKYETISGIFLIGEKEFLVERRWHERGSKGKVFINERPILVDDFSDFLLSELNIPILHYPKGNPYSAYSWPTLSWRTLLRHIYRKQNSWNNFADKQPEGEQHACIMQFTGLAEYLFSDAYGELVNTRKKILKLQGVKEEYLNMLDEISRDLLEEKELKGPIVEQAIEDAISRIFSEITNLEQQRERVLDNLLKDTIKDDSGRAFERLSETWQELQSLKEKNILMSVKIDERLSELVAYRDSLNNELKKMERAKKAGRLLADIKITHCPACDQSVAHTEHDADHCFLCHQPNSLHSDNGPDERINYEENQLKEELNEIEDLIKTIQKDQDVAILEHRKIGEEIVQVESQMKPARQIASAILPPDIAVIDMNIGRLQERIRQLERVKGALQRRENLSKEIDSLEKELAELEIQVSELTKNLTLQQSGDKIATGMNEYLYLLRAEEKDLWSQGRVEFNLKRQSFNVKVDNNNWASKLGGTLTLYFFLSYHYALMSLTKLGKAHYPGIAVLDLPPTLEDGSTVMDKENFVLEPFVKLLNEIGMEKTQMIVTGAAFENLDGANRIEFTKVWK